MTRPRSLSVVVAAWNSPALLRACLRSLAEATLRGDVELIVAAPSDGGFGELLAAEFPRVIGVTVAQPATVPRLRSAGLARATGEIIAFIEDHATVAEDWTDALQSGYATADCAALGGPVAQGNGLSSLDWGMYLFDYGRFAPPQRAGVVHELSGINMSFSRTLLGTLPDVLRDGVFEGALQAELARRQVPLFLAPSAIVYHHKRYALRPALASVYHLGRGYAARRAAHSSRAAQLARAAACMLLPAVLLWRVLSIVLPKGQNTARVLGATGYLALAELWWSGGECMGYLAGAGDSDSRWR